MCTEELLLNNIGGLNSIMSIVSLCFYNSIIVEDVKLKNIMKYILDKEMKHLESISYYVYRLGLDPRFWAIEGDSYQYWSPSYNIYPKHTIPLINNLINQIENMISIYEHQIKTIDNYEITDILSKIIVEEHKEIEKLRSY